MSCLYAVIADIISSRELPDRVAAQQELEAVLSRSANGLELVQEPYATVGDEFQAVARTLEDALSLTLRVGLLLPAGLALRFGVGAGQMRAVGQRPAGVIQDGSAWWAAREAVDAAHAAQDAGLGFVRTRYRRSPEEGQVADPSSATATVLQAEERYVNALLALRDQAVDRMAPRPRRLVGHLLMGSTQAQAAALEGVTQSAVSDLVRGSAAGLLESHRLLSGSQHPGPAFRSPRELRRKP